VRTHYPPRPRERPILQVVKVRRAFPQFRWHRTHRNGVQWSGTLQPTPDSPLYVIRLVHEPPRSPKVWVVSPGLHPDAPHRYPADGTLCLYWPREWSWDPRHSLADTIIPWAALWLYYYEIWLVTGDWVGPCSPHRPGSIKEAA